MGDEQPRAEQTGTSGVGEPPDVIDLRPHEDPASGSAHRALSASEGWEWLDLGLRISDAQLDARRVTSRPMNIDRTDLRVRPAAPTVAPEPATSRTAEPAIELPAETAKNPSTRSDWLTWVRLGRTISATDATGAPATGAAAAPVEEEREAEAPPEVVDEPEVVDAQPDSAVAATEPQPQSAAPPVHEVAEREPVSAGAEEPRRGLQFSWKPLAVLIAIVVVVAAVAVALASRDDGSGQRVAGGPGASAAPSSAAAKSFAVIWLEQNTAAGTRLLVPPELVDNFTAGLPGRQVLPNDDTAVQNGDLIVVTPNSGDVLEGTLTQQVLASAPVLARLPGSDLDVRQVTGSDPAGDAARASAGAELLQNLGLTFVGDSAAALRSGRVDERVLVILAGLAAQHSLKVSLLHDAAAAPDAQVRTLQIEAVDGHPLSRAGMREIEEFVTAQRGALAGPVVATTKGAQPAITVRYLLPDSVDLLSGGSFPTIPETSP